MAKIEMVLFMDFTNTTCQCRPASRMIGSRKIDAEQLFCTMRHSDNSSSQRTRSSHRRYCRCFSAASTAASTSTETGPSTRTGSGMSTTSSGSVRFRLIAANVGNPWGP